MNRLPIGWIQGQGRANIAECGFERRSLGVVFKHDQASFKPHTSSTTTLNLPPSTPPTSISPPHCSLVRSAVGTFIFQLRFTSTGLAPFTLLLFCQRSFVPLASVPDILLHLSAERIQAHSKKYFFRLPSFFDTIFRHQPSHQLTCDVRHGF